MAPLQLLSTDMQIALESASRFKPADKKDSERESLQNTPKTLSPKHGSVVHVL